MVKIKKDRIKNIYCGTCKTWMTEFYVSRHLCSKSHFMKKHFKRLKIRVNRKLKSITQSDENMICKTPENQQGHEEFKLQGETLKRCSHNHNNRFLDGCSDLYDKYPVEASITSKKELFERNQPVQTYEYPQNQLGLWNIDTSFDFEIVLLDDEKENVEPQVSFSTNSKPNLTQEELNTSTSSFPVEILSGVFPPFKCEDPHYNQILFYKCQACIPATYKNYENW